MAAPDLTRQAMDTVTENPQRFGFDSVKYDEFYDAYCFEVYGVTKLIGVYELNQYTNGTTHYLDEVIREMKHVALEGLRRRGQQQQAAMQQIICSAAVDVNHFATCATGGMLGNEFNRPQQLDLEKREKAEKKALLLMQNIIGSKQCDAYRQWYRVIAKPSKYFWIIGDIFGKGRKHLPPIIKPDVVRLDDSEKLYYTSFCVQQDHASWTPYTDQVISFTMHLLNNENDFVKRINRITEDIFKKMLKCAVFEQ